MMGYYYDGIGIFGGFFMILFWVLIIWIIITLVRMANFDFFSKHRPSSRPDNSLAILKERYAKGEITKKEFEEMKHDLES